MTLVSVSINPYTFLQTFASLSAYFWKYFLSIPFKKKSLTDAQMVKNLPAMWEPWIRSLGWEDPWRRAWQPTPVFLPGEFHGQRSLVGYSPWGRKESDTTERLILLLLQGCLRNLSSSKTAFYSPGNLTHAYTTTPFLLTRKIFYNSH